MSSPQGHEDLSRLGEWFPKELEQSRKKGGATLTYIPVSEIIARANEVWGLAWSYRTVDASRYTDEFGDWVVAHVEVTVRLADGNVCSRDGFGGQDVSSMKTGKYLDLGDEYKGAVSDALKKALMSFGIALYLARGDRTGTTFTAVEAPRSAASSPGREDGVLDELKALSVRATGLGLDSAALLSVCEKALGAPVPSSNAIRTHAQIEAINAALDALPPTIDNDKETA